MGAMQEAAVLLRSSAERAAGAEACARLLALADKYRVDECVAAAADAIRTEVIWLL